MCVCIVAFSIFYFFATKIANCAFSFTSRASSSPTHEYSLTYRNKRSSYFITYIYLTKDDAGMIQQLIDRKSLSGLLTKF